LHSYHDIYKRFPSGIVSPLSGPIETNSWSWLAMILPYIDHDNVQRSALAFAKTVSWNVYAAPSHPAASIVLQAFKCPSEWRSLLASDSLAPFVVGYTSYLGVSGTSGASNRSFGPGGPQDGIFFEDSKVRISSILDGTSNTLMVAERPPANDMIL